MSIYKINIPVTINAHQWFKNGDHPDDRTINRINSGKVVGRWKSEYTPVEGFECKTCGKPMRDHGVLLKPYNYDPTKVISTTVCPGDYIETIYNEKRHWILGYILHKRKDFELLYILDESAPNVR